MALRLIELLLPETGGDELEKTLAEMQVIDSWRQKTQEGRMLLRILAEADDAESIIDTFEDKYARHSDFRAVLLEASATSPPVEIPEAKQQRPEEKAETEKQAPERVACLELVEKMTEGVEISRNYVLTIGFSVVVAAIGLVRNNVAVIIGAMVIAPLLTPNMALSLATTLGDAALARRALKASLFGIAEALALSVLVGLVIYVDPASFEIASRTTVGYSDIALAMAAGGAGALAFTSGVSAALVGVMVAVAILPPIAAAGLLIGSGYLILGAKALLLMLVNIICVNLAGVGMFLLQGIRPRFYWETARARRMVQKATAVWLGLLLLLMAAIYLSQRFIR